MNEDEMIDKMDLGKWIRHENKVKTAVSLSAASPGNVLAGIVQRPDGNAVEGTGIDYMTPDEAEAFGLRLVAAAGIVRARQATKEGTNDE